MSPLLLTACSYLIMIFTFFALSAEIIEVKHFGELLPFADGKTLVILDIDDTLLIPVQTLGTDVWFISRLKYHLQQEKQREMALDKALAEWEAVRHMTKIKIVEEGTAEMIQQLQNRSIVVMGLTTQGLALATRTRMQLLSLNIDLSLNAPFSEDHYFLNQGQGVLYRNGILFTSGSPKGKALMKFFDHVNCHPSHVVFLNDKNTHLMDVGETLESHGISFIGLRYSYGDDRIAHYSQEIADIQWKHSTFNHILSDDEAKSLLKEIYTIQN